MSPRLSEETGRVLGGRYRLVAPIGVGTSSRVFLAVDTQLRRRVAVKLLHEALAEDEAFLRRFRAEARAAGALNHPNIVAVFDWGEDRSDGDVIPYLVTEYLAGGSLRSMLDRHPLLSPSQTLLVGLDSARALTHAHMRGLVHRDVKPANLLFDTEGRLRLADFGLARALAEASWTEPTGTTVGTARYASPEQALGRRLDGRSDVYSLALVLVECLTGQVPFTADTTAATLAIRTQGDLELGPELGGLRSVLERAGRLDPDERPEAAEFEIALMAAAEEFARPDPLPIVPTLGDGQDTSEMHLVRGLGPISAISSSELADATDGESIVPVTAAFRDPEVLPDPPPEVIGDESAAAVPGTTSSIASTNGSVVAASPSSSTTDATSGTATSDPATSDPATSGPATSGRTADDVADADVEATATEPEADSAAEPETAGAHDAALADTAPDTDAADRTVATESSAPQSSRDPITVAQEHELLSGSRPASFGKVEPFEGAPAPSVTELTPRQQKKADKAAAKAAKRSARATTKQAKSSARSTRRWPRRLLAVFVVMALIGGAAAAWWFVVRVPVHDVPDFSGMSVQSATSEAEELGWNVDAGTVDRRDGTEPGDILEQSPAPGDSLAEGEDVVLTVSLGATLTAVPDLVGKPEPEATGLLVEQGLVVGAVTRAFDEAAPKDSVMSAAPADGEPALDDNGQLPRGTVMDLVVSDGPAPRILPANLQGATLEGAEAALAAVQLEAAVARSYSETVPEGYVISVDGEPGAELARGTEVPLEVSRGPAPIVVPDVRYNTGSMAAQTLESAGFEIAGIEGSPSGMVLATDPVAGESHPRGTAIRIFTRS